MPVTRAGVTTAPPAGASPTAPNTLSPQQYTSFVDVCAHVTSALAATASTLTVPGKITGDGVGAQGSSPAVPASAPAMRAQRSSVVGAWPR